MNLVELIKKGLKFCITGGLNTVIDFAVTTVLNVVLHLNINVAKPIGYLCGMANSFVMNKKWTFKTENRATKKELIKFILVNACMLGLSLVLINLFKTHLNFGDTLSNLLSTAVVMVINFLISNFWVFKK